jgi:hypothetical protein
MGLTLGEPLPYAQYRQQMKCVFVMNVAIWVLSAVSVERASKHVIVVKPFCALLFLDTAYLKIL